MAFWHVLVPVGLVVAVGLALSGSKAKKRIAELVQVNVLGMDEGGGITMEFDDLTSVREAGYVRAKELGFGDDSLATVVLDALVHDRDKRIPKDATLRAVRVGSVREDSWEQILSVVQHTPATETGQQLGTWGALKAQIDEFMRQRGML